jgi:DNA-binding CsgD family transcriptional regulator
MRRSVAPKVDQAKVLKLRAEGLTYQLIGQRMNVSVTTVAEIVRKNKPKEQK